MNTLPRIIFCHISSFLTLITCSKKNTSILYLSDSWFYLSFRRMSCTFFILFGKRSPARKDSLYHSNMVGGKGFSFRWQLAKYAEQIYICWLWKLMLPYYQYRVATCIHQVEYQARRSQSTLSVPCLQKKTDGKKQMGEREHTFRTVDAYNELSYIWWTSIIESVRIYHQHLKLKQ